jgi:hypothetical protein
MKTNTYYSCNPIDDIDIEYVKRRDSLSRTVRFTWIFYRSIFIHVEFHRFSFFLFILSNCVRQLIDDVHIIDEYICLLQLTFQLLTLESNTHNCFPFRIDIVVVLIY